MSDEIDAEIENLLADINEIIPEKPKITEETENKQNEEIPKIEIKENKEEKTEEKNEKEAAKKQRIEVPQKAQFSIIVSNLPNEANVSMIAEFCKNSGVLATHPETGENLILFNPKMHKATVTYCYQEAVNQSLKLLNNATFLATGARVKVERAPREPYDFSQWKGAMKMSRKLHSLIVPVDEETKFKESKIRRVIIMKNVFDPKELIEKPELYGQIVKDITGICEEIIKEVKEETSLESKCTLVKPMERNPEGIVIVRFDNECMAAHACGKLDEFEYRGRTITVDPWDGVEIPEERETEEELNRRIEQFHAFQEKR